MAKKTVSKLSKLSRNELIDLLNKEGIEASMNQKKTELVRLLELAQKANEPTGYGGTISHKIHSNFRRHFWLFFGLLFMTIIGLLYLFNPIFQQNVRFLSYKVFRVGSNPISNEDSAAPLIYEKNGKTYVVYSHPLIKVRVITDTSCKRPECDLNNYYDQIKSTVTELVKFEEIDYKAGQAQTLISELNINLLPVFIFDSTVEKIDNFEETQKFFTKAGNNYVLLVKPLKALKGPKLEDAQVLGKPVSENAALKIIVFTSFSSPHGRDAVPTIDQLLTRYDGNVSLFIKYAARGGNDFQAAVAAECAAKQSAFKPMHDKLFANQDQWMPLDSTYLGNRFTKYAAELKINTAQFRKCYDSDETMKALVKTQNDEALALGVSGTPTFFVNNQILAGAYPIESLVSIINEILKEDGVSIDLDLKLNLNR